MPPRPDQDQDISWQWIQEALPSIKLNKVIFFSLFSNVSCWSYIACSPSLQTGSASIFVSLFDPCIVHLTELAICLSWKKPCLMTMCRRSINFPTPWPPRCSPSAICSPWKPSRSYYRRCYQAHGYIRIKNTCAFVCVPQQQTFSKHLKPWLMR